SLSENFNGATVTGALSVPAGWDFNGSANKTGGGRNFVATVDADYSTVNFVFMIDFTLAGGGGPGIAFFGIGSAAPNASWFGTPADAFWAEGRPGDFDAGDVQWSTMAGSGTNPPEVTFGTAGDGSHRLKIEKIGTNITLSIDVGANGTFDGSVTKSLTADLPFLNNTNSRLFFGTESGNATFDNLSITVVPEPGSSALSCLAALSVLRRRRR
ncbi:MAG TPA: PEP-CTERM sorting domain-containing protein, partial [Verrucomicrobiales bacterium]|nr:PEP-CTERM sorting domain-containing protein [Verrucomicrobiales bacterium]